MWLGNFNLTIEYISRLFYNYQNKHVVQGSNKKGKLTPFTREDQIVDIKMGCTLYGLYSLTYLVAKKG